VTLGKGLAGGVAPAGAVVLSQRVAGMLAGQLWQTYSTFRGHPLTVAAISATVRRIGRDGLVERAASLDPMLRARMSEIAAAHPCVLRMDGLGLHWTLELRGGDWRDWHADTSEPTTADRVVAAALEAGVLIATSAEETSLFIAPPLTVSDEELDTILEVLDRSLSVADGVLPEKTGS
jgi:4-aminobutyrate aminotransferase-like enzyme